MLACAGPTGCFDSDQKTPVALGTGSSGSTGAGTTWSPPDPWTTTQGGSGGASSTTKGTATCRDAIDCIQGCAGKLDPTPGPEPDLSCFLECEDGLTEEEALLLLRLTQCVARECDELGVCEPTPGSSSGGSGSDTGTSGASSGSAGSSGGLIPPCLECILSYALDPQPPGCLDEAAACK
jgi:hypothetical protein